MASPYQIPADLKLTKSDADTLLELAYLTTAVDGRLADEEVVAFKDIIGRLRGTPARDADVDALLDRFAGIVEPTDIIERVQKIAPTLPDPVRPIAFKLSVALGVADLDASEDESELQAVLAEALGFDDARVEELTAEVYATLDSGDDG